MTRRIAGSSLAAAAICLAAQLAASPAAAQQDAVPAAFDSAYNAWGRGDYVDALERLDRLLATPAASDALARAAVLTGERYSTGQLARDGTDPRWSPDGRSAAYSVGEGDSSRTIVIGALGSDTGLAIPIDGYGLSFAPSGDRVVYLVPEPGAAQARRAQVRTRELPAGEERIWATPGLAVHEVAWAGDDEALWALASSDDDDSVNQLHLLAPGGPARPVTGTATFKEDLRVSPGGGYVLFDDEEAIHLIATESATAAAFAGADDAAFAPNGSALVFVHEEGDSSLLTLIPLDGEDIDEPVVLLRTEDALANPALSADGRTVAFQRMGRENWEVWVAPAALEAEAGAEAEAEPLRGAARDTAYRLTHDVQHDLFPAFLADDRLLIVKGEGRHRRSFVYPTDPDDPLIDEWVPGMGEGMRLFHNNTVRTVAPEYEWAVSPDGTRILIVAERDGDTISPERGVYLTDLGQPVRVDMVRARVREQLAAERALREHGRALFEGVADDVRSAVADVSLGRIYGYEADLFRFGSKYVGEPGNPKAIDYIAETLRSFGYEPELQWFNLRGEAEDRSANVIATLPGTVHPDVVYVASSHFDSTRRGPGADDDTSGTAALLEAARVLAGRPQAATIKFAFFTGEEAGLLGSREFARRAVESGLNVVGALNNDMIGYANDYRLDNTIRYSNAGIRDLQHAAALLFTDLILYDAHYYKSTDAHALYDAFGDVIGGIGSYPILANPHYHRAHDVLETINHRLVTEVSKTTVASLMRMADGPSRVTGVSAQWNGDGHVDLRWEPAIESDVVGYVVAVGGDVGSRTRVRVPRATLPNVPDGARVGVKAVNGKGLESWDWAWVRPDGP
ncbi:MAG: M20/M25/M40 family metallo-hydrolase [Longimicrobiales bacterium]